MPRIPGTFNGGVPANLTWDPLNPPRKCDNCGMVNIHVEGCDGKFIIPITESECELVNENREWARLGMDTGLVTRNLFKMGNQMQAIINVVKDLVENGEDVLNEEYRRCTIDEMRRIRLQNEDQIKRAKFGLPPESILGPNGEPL